MRGLPGLNALALVAILAVVPLAAIGGPVTPTPSEADPLPHPTAFVPFSPNVRVNSGGTGFNFQVEPTMAINSQGRIFVGWKEAFTHNGGGRRVAFSHSTDGGATWAPNVLMPLLAYNLQSDPWLTVTAGDRVYFSRIAYDSPTSPGGIVVSNTTDGVAWGTPLLLDDAPNFADKQSHANDAAGDLYMVWNSDTTTGSSYQLMFSRSNDGGATWTPKLRVPDSTNGHLGGFVRVAPSGAVLATWWSWANLNVWFDRSLDGGVTWGTDVRVNDLAGSADSPLASDPPVLPAMAVAANGTIYVVWNDYRNGRPTGVPNGDFDIMFSRSADLGATWSPSRRLNDDATTARQWMPDLAVDPYGGVHVAWMDDRNGGHDVYYANSTDGGTTWGPNVRVTEVSTLLSYTRPGDYLAIESDRNGHVYVVWTDGRGTDLDIYFAKLERTVLRSIATVPPGLVVELDGIPYVAPLTFDCRAGTMRTIDAPSPQSAGTSRYVFAFWDDGGGQAHDIPCDQGGTSTALFMREHAVTVDTSPPNREITFGGTSYVAPQTFWVLDGAQAWVGVPSPQIVGPIRYVFESWSDGEADTHPVDVLGAITLVATFRTEYFLTLSSPRGNVSCDLSDCWYRAGETATFVVQPATEYVGDGTRHLFVSWSGDSSESDPIASVLMDRPRAADALWVTEHYLWVESPYGTPEGAGWHVNGSVVTARIEPSVTANGRAYRFVGWSGDAEGTNATLSVAMDGPKTVRALWEEVPAERVDWFNSLPAWIFSIAVALVILLVFLWRRRGRDEEEMPPPPPSAPPVS